jgi:hypothetical protein
VPLLLPVPLVTLVALQECLSGADLGGFQLVVAVGQCLLSLVIGH